MRIRMNRYIIIYDINEYMCVSLSCRLRAEMLIDFIRDAEIYRFICDIADRHLCDLKHIIL